MGRVPSLIIGLKRSVTMNYHVGDKIGEYTIRGELGRGEFGAVYLVEWRSSQRVRQGALKILVRNQTIKSILDEVSTWARVSHHPNILTFIGATEHNKQVLLISEYASGGSLDNWIKDHAGEKGTVNDAIRLMLGLLRGLQHLHDNDIVHRDIKPANILLNDDSPLLGDFGLARGLDLAQSSILGGTVLYMSPELVSAFVNQGPRTHKYERTEADDLWAAAVTFYEMLAHDLPFKSINEIISSNANPLPPHISPRLSDFTAKALNKDFSRRFQTAEAMRTALDEVRIYLQREPLVDTVSSEVWLGRHARNAQIDAEFALLDLTNPADFNRALELDKAGAYFNRGLAYAEDSNYQAAIEDWNKAIELYPQYQAAYNNRGLAYLYEHDVEHALEDYNRAIELDPNDAISYSNRGLVHHETGDYDRAIKDFSKAIELSPEQVTNYVDRGNAYDAAGDYDNAIRDHTKAITFGLQDPNVYCNRGASFARKLNYERAMEDFNKAIQLDPDDAGAYDGRGRVYDLLRVYDQALIDYDKAIELRPEDAGIYNNRGWTYHNRGDFDAAVSDFDKAIELNPRLAVAYTNRASAYEKLGDRLKAKADRNMYEELSRALVKDHGRT